MTTFIPPIIMSSKHESKNPSHISIYFFAFPLDLLLVFRLGGGVSSPLSAATSTPELSSLPPIIPPSSSSVSLLSESIPLSTLRLRCASLALRSASQPCTRRVTSSSRGFSFPFHALHPPHRHRPTSSRVRAPGGACPLTSRHSEQIKTKRFLACVSSSPRRASRMRSYQWVCVKAAGESCVYCLVRSGPPLKALGANSAPGASGGGGCCVGGGPWGDETFEGISCGVIGRCWD